MGNLSSSVLIEAFVVVMAVLGFVFVGEEIRVFPSGNPLFDLFEVGLFGFISTLVLLGITKGNVIFFFVTLVILGLFFILFASAITVPYAVTETFSQPASRDLTPDIYDLDPPYGAPYADNGSSKVYELPSNSTKLFLFGDWGYLYGNRSIIQINVSSTFSFDKIPLGFSIVGLTEGSQSTYFKMYFIGYSSPNSTWWLENWVSWYWTPPNDFPNYGNKGCFLFENLSNDTMLFRFNVMQYYQDNGATKQVTRYRTFMNPDFFYVGVVLIGSATCLEVYFQTKERKSKPNTASDTVLSETGS